MVFVLFGVQNLCYGDPQEGGEVVAGSKVEAVAGSKVEAVASDSSSDADAADGDAGVSATDSIDVSLVTCAPGSEAYTIFGHTAVRVNDRRENGKDMMFNYGIFSFKAKFFVLRFIFGLTDYELACYPTDLFLKSYGKEGRQVIEQQLNLTSAEKEHLLAALIENCQPENKVYRYNYFYDNCTTRARNIIASCIDGRLEYQWGKGGETYREAVHQYNAAQPWTRFGEDILLGVAADREMTNEQRQFLPINLENDYINAVVHNNDGSTRRLVGDAKELQPSGITVTTESFPLTPNETGVWLMLITAILTFVEWKRRQSFWWLDVLFMLVCGICGIIVFAMIFSEHPTVSLNMNILLFNPLPLFFIPITVARGVKKLYNPIWRYWLPLLLLYLVVAPLIQRIPLPLVMLTVCILMRALKIFRKQ